jgi:amino acid adenylation domain-containing protein
VTSAVGPLLAPEHDEYPLPVAGRPATAAAGNQAGASARLGGLAGPVPAADQLRRSAAAVAAALERYGRRGTVQLRARRDGRPVRLRLDLAVRSLAELAASMVIADEPDSSEQAAGAAPVEIEVGTSDGPAFPPLAGIRFSFGWDAEQVVIRCLAAPDQAADSDCARMAAHVASSLQALLTGPDADYRQSVRLTAGELAAVEALRTARPRTGPAKDLISRFETVVARQPESVAIVDGRSRLSYRQLRERAVAIAEALVAAGVAPGELVGLSLGRTADLPAALIGILMCGAAYVPIEPDCPPARLEAIARDAALAALVVADEGTGLGQVAARLVCLDQVPAASTAPPPMHPDPDSLAYVMYTSGSTGAPKGVQVTHDNVGRLFDSCFEHSAPRRSDVWTMFHSYAFDFSVWELWGALLTGARLVVVDYLTSRDPRAFGALLLAEGVSILSQTPSAFAQLLAGGTDLSGSALRLVVLGGEAVNPAVLADWFDSAVGRRAELVNMYGITETTVHVTWRTLRAADAAAGTSPIGRPLADLGVRLIDELGRPTPMLIAGELQVCGAGLAAGYLGAAQLTEQRFPVAPDGTRWYRSGDLARLQPDGELTYVGRADRQVKVRGFRIELGDIEHALSSHPLVGQAVAGLLPSEGGRPVLAAFVTVAHDGVTKGELTAHLRRRLPAHMLPGHLGIVDRMPLTNNGKVDFAALVEAAGEPVSAVPGPAGGGERLTGAVAVLADIWTSLLGVRPGRDDQFLEIGGDSMSMVEMLAEAHRAGLPIELRQVLAGQTLAELAGSVATDPTVAAVAAQVHDAAPVASADPTLDEIWAAAPAVPPTAARVVEIVPPRDSNQPPLLLLPWGSGSVAFLKRLPPEAYPGGLYGIESIGMHDGARPLTDMIDIGQRAAAAVAGLGRPEVHFGGFCFGAAVAMSAADAVADSGVRIRSLVLVDPVLPDPSDPSSDWTVDEFLSFHLNRIRHRYGEDAQQSLDRLALRGILDSDEPAERFFELVALWSANAYAGVNWKPEPYAGEVLLAFSETGVPRVQPSPWAPWLDLSRAEVVRCLDAPDTIDLLANPVFEQALNEYLRRH